MFALRAFCVRGRTRALYGQAADIRPAADGRAFVGCRQFETFRDGRRCAVDGLATGLRRADNGLLTDYTRACLRTYDGRAAVAERPPYHGLLTDEQRAAHGRHTDGETAHRLQEDRRVQVRLNGKGVTNEKRRVAFRSSFFFEFALKKSSAGLSSKDDFQTVACGAKDVRYLGVDFFSRPSPVLDSKVGDVGRLAVRWCETPLFPEHGDRAGDRLNA